MNRDLGVGRLERHPGGTLVARPPQHAEDQSGCGTARHVDTDCGVSQLGQPQLGAFAGNDRRGNGDARRGEAAHAQHVEAVCRAVEARITHLDDVPTGLCECLLKAAVEVQTRIVVALGDETAFRVADGDQRIDVLAEPIADRLEADALAGSNVDGVAIHGRLAEPAPQRDRQRHLRRRRTGVRRGPHR